MLSEFSIAKVVQKSAEWRVFAPKMYTDTSSGQKHDKYMQKSQMH